MPIYLLNKDLLWSIMVDHGRASHQSSKGISVPWEHCLHFPLILVSSAMSFSSLSIFPPDILCWCTVFLSVAQAGMDFPLELLGSRNLEWASRHSSFLPGAKDIVNSACFGLNCKRDSFRLRTKYSALQLSRVWYQWKRLLLSEGPPANSP